MQNFNKKIKNVNVQINKMQSFTNPSLLKDEITSNISNSNLNSHFF